MWYSLWGWVFWLNLYTDLSSAPLYSYCEVYLLPSLFVIRPHATKGASVGKFFASRRYNSNSNSSIASVFDHAIKIYNEPLNQRSQIREENNGKVGVYCWVNDANGKYYIGSGDPLYLRLSDYYQPWYLLARLNLYIVRALSKYGMINFSLIILEYTSSSNLISSEQKWIDLLKPEYNTNPTAGSTKGYTHSAQSIEKIRYAVLGRKHSEEVRREMSESRRGKNNPFFGKTHSEEALALIKAAAENRVKPSVPVLKLIL